MFNELEKEELSRLGYSLEQPGENLLLLSHNYQSTLIPYIEDKQIYRYPQFIYKGKVYNINELIRICVMQRLRSYEEFAIPYLQQVRIDIDNILASSIVDRDGIEHRNPTRYNSILKLSHKYKLLKHWKKDGKDEVEIPQIGDIISSKNSFDREETRNILRGMNLSLCKVDSFVKNIIVSLPPDTNFLAPAFGSNLKSYYTFFENAPSVPTRLTQAITSDGLLPVYDKCQVPSVLNGNISRPILRDIPEEIPYGGINAVVAYIPEVLSNDMFLAGEIYSSRGFSNNLVKLERTINIPYPLERLTLMNIGETVNHGDIIAHLDDGSEDFRFNLPFHSGKYVGLSTQSDLTIQKRELNNDDKAGKNGITAQIVLKFEIETHIGSARLVSDFGTKGCTMPLNDFGEFITEDDKQVHVDLAIGPNALKGKESQIRLGSLAYIKHKQSRQENLIINNDEDAKIVEEKVNAGILTKAIWKSPFGIDIPCYIGIEHMIVTKLSNDCKFSSVKIAPEMLRFLVVSKNYELVQQLLNNYLDKEMGELLTEVVDIISQKPHPKFHGVFGDNIIQLLRNSAIDIRTIIVNGISESFLNSESNQGFSIAVDGDVIRFPSYKLISKFTYKIGYQVYYHSFFSLANRILLSLRNGYANNQLLRNIELYTNQLQGLLLSKKGLVARASSVNVEGGNFQQLPCHLVPKGITVLPHWSYEYNNHPLMKSEQYDLYDIGCRNPALWLGMIKSRRLWTHTEFKDYLEYCGYDLDRLFAIQHYKGVVLRNPQDCMEDQSDADGDLYPLTVPLRGDIQKYCRPVYTDNPGIKCNSIGRRENYIDIFSAIYLRKQNGIFQQPITCKLQADWTANYRKGEQKKLSVEDSIFKINKIDKTQYAEYFASGAVAKKDVGIATISLWCFNTGLEVVLQQGLSYNDGITLMTLYAMLLQDYVIRGIKHSFESSDNFNIFLVDQILSKTPVVTQVLKQYNLSDELIEWFYKIVIVANTESVKAYALMPNGSTRNFSSIWTGIVSILKKQPLVKESLISRQILESVFTRAEGQVTIH